MPTKQEKAKNDSPNDLFSLSLRDLLSTETQVGAAFPELLNQASSPDLVGILKSDIEETEVHRERIASLLGKQQEGPNEPSHLPVMKALLDQISSLGKKKTESSPIDIELAIEMSKLGHYKISSYRTICTLAESSANSDALAVLQLCLDEETKAAEKVEAFAREQLGLKSLPSSRSEFSESAHGARDDERKSEKEDKKMPRTEHEQESQRNRSTNDRERDDQGRFVSNREGMRSRDDYEGRYRGRGDDDDRNYSDRGRGRYDEDDRDRGRGQGDRSHGGWFGDPRGHSEASREGWEHRRGQGGQGGYDERDYSRSSRGQYDDDRERGRGQGDRSQGDRGQGGWYGDPRGHSEASREGWEHRGRGRSDYDDRDYSGGSRGRDYDDRDRDRGRSEGRGWYGDPQGHSEASREGWEHRRGQSGGGQSGGGRSGGYEDRDYSRSSRNRDYDDDRGRGESRGEGRGWYGDSQGHSEAAREGWRNRGH